MLLLLLLLDDALRNRARAAAASPGAAVEAVEAAECCRRLGAPGSDGSERDDIGGLPEGGPRLGRGRVELPTAADVVPLRAAVRPRPHPGQSRGGALALEPGHGRFGRG